MIGITTKGKGKIFPLGAKAGTSWDEINREWKEKQIKLPDGSILICDGEPGLSEAFAEYASEQQRCHWHIKRVLKRFADSSKWENYWDKKMNILANVVVLVKNYKASSQNFGQ